MPEHIQDYPGIKEQMNFALHYKGTCGNQDFDWSTFALADLQYVVEMANKSILKKFKRGKIIKDLQAFQRTIQQKLGSMDVNGYFWIMLVINRLLDDDHSSIKLNNLE